MPRLCASGAACGEVVLAAVILPPLLVPPYRQHRQRPSLILVCLRRAVLPVCCAVLYCASRHVTHYGSFRHSPTLFITFD
ncbi:hypothetical protein E2C01_062325 [Portunus trituberculatus]|uniref:Uncharacterized protein n=1 Tax=Portunus trituberculatus TaxID=210409 RepID=A0A5B7H7K1_PORTR|nr:hypothetical protein [Portunus trituberculatus]